jgi:hypothetical protein
VEERFERRHEEVLAGTAVAGLGAVLVGIGVALAYLLGRRPKDHILWTAQMTLEEDGSVSRYDVLNVYVDRDRPPRRQPVLWFVTNKGPERVLSFENFERLHDRKKITPLEKEPGQRIRTIPSEAPAYPVPSAIDREAVAELLADRDPNRPHKYKYDIWVDRVLQKDPEIAIIRR